MKKTDLYSSLLFLMIKLEDARNNPMMDKNFIVALTEVLRYFRDNGELKKAYKFQKDSLEDMINSPWTEALMAALISKKQKDGVDVELPNMNALVENFISDEYIDKQITYLLGEQHNENKE